MNLYFDFTNKDSKRILLREGVNIIDEVVFNNDNTIGSIQKLLDNNNINIDNIESADFKRSGKSFTGLRIASALANSVNFYKGNIKDVKDIKLPDYPSEAHITWSEKNR